MNFALPPRIYKGVFALATAIAGAMISGLIQGQIPQWAIWAMVVSAVVVALAVMASLLEPVVRGAITQQRLSRFAREEYPAIRGFMTSLTNAVTLSDMRCIHGLCNRLSGTNGMKPDTVVLLGAHLRALSSWLSIEASRADVNQVEAVDAFASSTTILTAYVTA